MFRYAAGVREACWLTALAAIPIFFNIYSNRVFEPDKIALIRTLAIVSAAAWLFGFFACPPERFRAGGMIGRTAARLRESPLEAALLLFLGVQLLSTVLSLQPALSFFGSYYRSQGTLTLLCFLLLGAAPAFGLRSSSGFSRLFDAVALGSVPVSLYGIMQHYRLEPMQWAVGTAARVKGNMGNEIFLAAYLILASIVLLGQALRFTCGGRTLWVSQRKDRGRLAVYFFVLVLNLTALWYTQSRGPQLAFACGLYFLLLLSAACFRWRRLAWGLLAAGLLVLTLGWLHRLPDGPQSPWMKALGLERLSRLAEELRTTQGTAGVRWWIWDGTVRLIQPHAPIRNPESGEDRLNFLRPLLGYGPETLSLVFPRFYPPPLGRLEKVEAIADRAHSELLDIAAGSGVLGGLAYLWIWAALVRGCLGGLGLIGTTGEKRIFWYVSGMSSLLVTTLFVRWGGWALSALGLVIGLLAGWAAFLFWCALRNRSRYPEPTVHLPAWQSWALIGFLAALLAHLAESNLSLTVAATQINAWIFMGCCLALLHRSRDSVPSRTGARENPETSTGWMVALVLLALSYSFGAMDFQTLLGSESGSAEQGLSPAAKGLFLLFLVTWGAGARLIWADKAAAAKSCPWRKAAAPLLLPLLPGMLIALLAVRYRDALAGRIQVPYERMVESVDSFTGIFSLVLALLMVLLFGWSWFLRPRDNLLFPAFPVRRWRKAAAAAFGGLILWFSWESLQAWAVQPVRADMVYRQGLQAEADSRLPSAAALYERSLGMQPRQDYYYLSVARLRLRAALFSSDAREAERLRAEAERHIREARRLNPYHPDPTWALARLFHAWAIRTTGSEERRRLAEEAERQYGEAEQLSPAQVILLCERAGLRLQLLDDPTGAVELARRALDLNPQYKAGLEVMAVACDELSRRADAPAESQRWKTLAEEARRQALPPANQ